MAVKRVRSMGINFCKFHFPFVIDGWVDGWKIIKAKLHKRHKVLQIDKLNDPMPVGVAWLVCAD